MKEVIYNEHKINNKEINNTFTRVKILLINSKNEITLAFSDNAYHFVGGHVEKNETLNNALIREVEEETGIVLEKKEYKPFFKITQILKDYPKKGLNARYEYYYYEIKSEKLPDLNNTHYTEEEKNGNFELRKVHLNNIEDILKETMSWGEKNFDIAITMLEAIKEYKKLWYTFKDRGSYE